MKNPFSLFPFLTILTSSVLWSVPAAAQEAGERGRALRILAVGEAPPYEERIVNGVRVQQDPPKGSEPPLQIQLSNGEGAELGNAVRVRMGQISGIIPVAPGRLPLHETGEGGLDPNPWHSITFPGNAAAGLAILWRDPQVGKWTKAKSLVLPDDTRSFPAGRIRIINVSKFNIGLQIGNETGALKPGSVILRAGQAGVFKNVPLRLSLKNKAGKWVKVFDQAINQSARERTNVVLYTADGEESLKPVNAVILREAGRTPVPPKPKRNPR